MSYSIEVMEDAIIVRGTFPITHFSALTSLAPRNAIVAIDLHSRYQASLICASRGGAERLRAIAPKRPIPAAIAPLSEGARTWWTEGQHGESALALFEAQLNIRLGRAPRINHPLDLDDFRRCVRMLEAVPEARRDGFDRVASCSSAWNAISAHWDEILSLMDTELPDWRDVPDGHRYGESPKAAALLDQVLRGI